MLPYFLERLRGMDDGGTDLLEKTMIVFGSPMADGNLHNHRRCPVHRARRRQRKLQGRCTCKAPDGTPMANVMLSLMHELGLDDMESFGDSTERSR
jgi:hypothetical protein